MNKWIMLPGTLVTYEHVVARVALKSPGNYHTSASRSEEHQSIDLLETDMWE